MYEYSTGAIIPNATMVLGPLQQRPYSGGHDHDSPARPKGFLSAYTGFTGSTGLQFQSVYTAPEVSGHVQSSISCTAPGYPSCEPGDFFVFATAVPNLVSLPQSNSYALIGSTPEHTSNHFATLSFATKLAALANMYFIKYGELPNPNLSFNDISLESGGLFDIAANWIPPHREHRIGVTADMRTPPATRVKALSEMMESVGILGPNLIHPPPKAPHWHIREFATKE